MLKTCVNIQSSFNYTCNIPFYRATYTLPERCCQHLPYFQRLSNSQFNHFYEPGPCTIQGPSCLLYCTTYMTWQFASQFILPHLLLDHLLYLTHHLPDLSTCITWPLTWLYYLPDLTAYLTSLLFNLTTYIISYSTYLTTYLPSPLVCLTIYLTT